MIRNDYKVKKCPKCGAVYERKRIYGVWRDEKMVSFGNVFRRCPRCMAEFRDPYACEPAVMDPPRGFLQKVHVISVVMTVLVVGIIALYVATADGFHRHTIGLILFGIMAGILIIRSDYVRYLANKELYDKELIKSKERLKSDPKYALKLKNAGINVPDEYLPKEEAVKETPEDTEERKEE